MSPYESKTPYMVWWRKERSSFRKENYVKLTEGYHSETQDIVYHNFVDNSGYIVFFATEHKKTDAGFA